MIKILEEQPFVFGFGNKRMDSLSKLEKLLESKGYSGLKIFKTKQIHSIKVGFITDSSDPDIFPECDGLITTLPGMVLVIRTADCVPLLFYDNQLKIAGAAHCGWLGTYENMAQNMVKTFIRIGSDVKNVKVQIGPCVGACCYRIYGERYAKILDRYPEYESQIFPVYNSFTGLDLARFNYLQMLKAGMDPQNIRYQINCTSCNSDNYYSHLRGDRGQNMLHFIFRPL